jgi:dolichol kinase
MAFDWSFTNTPFFMIVVQIYFSLIAFFTLYYAFKTRKNPEKIEHKEFFINELIMGVMLILFVIIFPFFYDRFNLYPSIKAQIYFHTWDSLTVNILCWGIYFITAYFNNKKYHTSMTFDEFKVKFNGQYKDSLLNDFTRKLLHLIGPPIIVGVFYICQYLGQTGTLAEIAPGWTPDFATIFMIIAIILGFLLALPLSDLIRFYKFPWYDSVGQRWMLKALRPKELDTITSAAPMLLAGLLFASAPSMIFFSACFIACLSDAAACLVGKFWGKIHPHGSKKTLEGYIAGFITTFACVLFCNWLVPLPNANTLLVIAMALGASIGFLIVDIYAKTISDNFLNPVVCGIIIWALYLIFV